MSVGGWRNGGGSKPRRTATPRAPLPGFPILTGMTEKQHGEFTAQVGGLADAVQNLKNGLTPEQQKSMQGKESARALYNKARELAGQAAKVLK